MVLIIRIYTIQISIAGVETVTLLKEEREERCEKNKESYKATSALWNCKCSVQETKMVLLYFGILAFI